MQDMTWQEMQKLHEEYTKRLTCPVCGKKCNQFIGGMLPMVGVISHGQWFCSTIHRDNRNKETLWQAQTK